MALDWGRMAGGAQDALQTLLEQRMLEEQMALAQRRQAAEEAHRAATLGETRAGREQQGTQWSATFDREGQRYNDPLAVRGRTATVESAEEDVTGKREDRKDKGVLRARRDDARGKLSGDPVLGRFLTAEDAGLNTTALNPLDPEGDTDYERRLGLVTAQANASAANQPRYTSIKEGVDSTGKPVSLGLTRGGQWEVIPNPDGATVRSPGKVTGAQDTAARFFARGREAVADMEKVEPALVSLIQQVGGLTPNVTQSREWQLYTNALRRYTESRLRKDSGAAVPPSEYEMDAKVYGITFGDKPETIEKKRQARRSTIAPLAFEARGALDNYYGEDEAARIRETFRPGSKAASEGGGGGKRISLANLRAKAQQMGMSEEDARADAERRGYTIVP